MRLSVYRILVICLTVFSFGCSDQPKQIGGKGLFAPNPGKPSMPATQDEVDSFDEGNGEERVIIIDNVVGREPTQIRIPRVLPGNPEENKIEFNGKRPIIFNGLNPFESSVAGVKFLTSYNEASSILSEPYLNACGDNNNYHREGLCMQWTDSEPRRLRNVRILGDYGGAIQLPEPLGSVKMGDELRSVFKPEHGEIGEELLKKTYNEFFKKEDSFDCLKEKECQAVLFRGLYINWILPNITIIFSNDRKVLIQLAINQDVPAGEFASPLDLVKGEILTKNNTLKLGEPWEKVQSKLEAETDNKSILTTKTFRKDFIGVIAEVQRKGVYGDTNEFKTSVLEASGDDIFTGFRVYSNYTEPILLNGRFVQFDYDENNKYQGLSLQVNRPTSDKILTVSKDDDLAGKLELQMKVLKDLGKLIKKEFINLSPNFIVNQRYANFNSAPDPNKRLILRTWAYDTKKKETSFIYIHVGVDTGNFLFLISKDNDPMSALSFPASQLAVDVKLKPEVEPGTEKEPDTLAGYEIGSKVRIYDIDRKRNEAFIDINGKVNRVEIDLFSSAKISTDRNLISSQKIIKIPNISGATLGLSTPTFISDDTTELEASIIYIGSGFNNKFITGICGTDDRFKIGMKKSVFQNRLRKLLQREAKLNGASFKCSPFVGPDGTGDEQIKSIYIPEQRLKILFSARELSGVAKYIPAAGGN